MKKARAALISLIIAMPVISCYEAPKSSTEQEIGAYLLFEYGAPNFCLDAPSYISTSEGATEGPFAENHCFRLASSGPVTIKGLPNPSNATFLMVAWTPLSLSRDPNTDELSVPSAVPDLWVWASCPDCTAFSLNF